MDYKLGGFMINNMNLKEIRINSGLTQKELSKRIGISQQQYSRYERKINKLPLQTFFKVLKACNIEVKLVKK